MPVRGALPPRNPRFAGREDLLTQVRALLSDGPVVLLPAAGHQFGGTGRTQLAVEYAHRYADTYDLVWWIPAEQPAMTRAALAALARELALPETNDLTRTLSAVREALNRGEPRRSWLIVFENADQPEDIAPYLPGGDGHVLVTSGNSRWSDELAQAVPVAVFGRADSVDFLRDSDPKLSAVDADRLADRLQDVPMALDLATAVRSVTGWPVGEYLRRYDERTGDPVHIAWSLAADGLQAASPAARQLLELGSFLAGAPVSWELFWAARGLDLSPELAHTLRVERRLKAALRLISRYGLADLDPAGERLLVHPLARDLLGRDSTDPSVVRAMLAAADPGDPDNPANHRRYAEIVPHLGRAEALDADAEEIRQLVINCIRFHYAGGDYESSRDLAARAVARWQTKTNEQTLLAQFHLANALRATGRTKEARDLNAETLRGQREAGDDELALATANSVGADLRLRGHFEQARQLDADNLVRYRRLLGESLPMALRCANNLAVDLRLLGDFRGARALDEQTLRQRQTILADGHSETLSSRAGLAFDLYGLGDYPAARAVLTAQWGEPGRLTGLWAGRFAAMAARRDGRKQARDLAEVNVAAFRQRFGEQHVETLGALVTLANCERSAGDLDAAHGLLEQAMAGYREVLGEEHPFTLAAAVDLAGVVRAAGRPEQARAMDAESLSGLRRSVGRDHPFTLSCANGFAADLLATGEAQPSYEIAIDTLTRSRTLRGDLHPDTLACAWNVALDSTDEASQENALADLIKLYGDQHPIPAAALRSERLETEIEPPPL